MDPLTYNRTGSPAIVKAASDYPLSLQNVFAVAFFLLLKMLSRRTHLFTFRGTSHNKYARVRNTNYSTPWVNFVRVPFRTIVSIEPIAATAIVTTAVGVGGLSVKLWKEYKERKKVSAETYVNNVLKKLNEPFKSPLTPDFGPVFPRGEWEENFRQLANRKMYLAYFGASSLGKSIAITHALSGRKGVILLRLHEAGGPSVTTRFVKDTNMLNRQVQLNFGEGQDVIMSLFADACKAFKEKEGMPPVMIVEDLHRCMSRDKESLDPQAEALVGDLVRIHNDGNLNVVYSMSDFTGILLLQGVSGHSSRLKVAPFPPIPRDILEDNLYRLTTVKQHEQLESHNANSFISKTTSIVLSKRDNKNENRFIIDKKEDCQKIVEHLGSHMGDTISCVRMIVEQGRSVDEAINSVIRAAEPYLKNALVGDEEVCKNLDRTEFLVTVHTVFELFNSGNEQVEDIQILKLFPTVPRMVILKSLRRLVELNLCSFHDKQTVTLHSRKLLYAYKNLASTESIKTEKATIDKIKQQK